jgi:hypothetical protein
MTTTVSDLTIAQIATELTNQGIDAGNASLIESWLTSHQINGLTPEEFSFDGGGDPIPAQTDAAGNPIQQLDIIPGISITSSAAQSVLNLDQFAGLHDVTVADYTTNGLNSGYTLDTINTLTASGQRAVSIYAGDLAAPTPHAFQFNLQGTTGADTVVMGDTNGDQVFTGSGADKVTLGNGAQDNVVVGGSNQTIVVGTGAGSVVDGVVSGGGGLNEHITVNGVGDQIQAGDMTGTFSGGTGSHVTIVGTGTIIGSTGGGDTLEAYDGTSTVTAKGPNDTLIDRVSSTLDGGTFANTTFVDGVTMTGSGAGDVFNIGNNNGLTQANETATGTGAGAVFNVADPAYLAGQVTINTNAEGTVNFADSWTNATVTSDGGSGWIVSFADNGAIDHVMGVNQANLLVSLRL